LFNHRASIRWKRKDYQAALDDWKAALALEPKNASMCAKVAEAYINLGQKRGATEYYQKAAELDPENKKYEQKCNALAGYTEREEI
jgi:Tfp pilus assembly protein PilF